ncbi:MAG: hypothetical protein K2Y05_01035 [Hyphomicrobiaceae bacterium]|nr:hypothetical protein [Hyphomicrobiaceae bacterium]
MRTARTSLPSMAVACWLAISSPVAAAPEIAWDRVANVKAAAQNIGDIQKRAGADAAYKFIGACYKTHGLASAFSKAFEGCIAQDYVQSRALALVYGRLSPEQLNQIGAPSADQLIVALQRRLGAAFGQYKIPAADGEAFLKLVDTHGMPVFMSTVFPGDKR